MRSSQRPAKLHDETKRKWSLFLPNESLSKMKLETLKSYLEWLDQRFKSNAFIETLPSKMLSTS